MSRYSEPVMPPPEPEKFIPPVIEWHQHKASNRSLTAKAHCTFNCRRLGMPIPAWAAPDSDAESTAILQMIEEIKHEEAERAEGIRRDHRNHRAAQGADVGRDAA
jgi:hypothetical protein